MTRSALTQWLNSTPYGTAWKGAKAFLLQRWGVHPRPEKMTAPTRLEPGPLTLGGGMKTRD